MGEASEDRLRCPHITSCELFPVFSQNGFLRVWQIRYCEADYVRCARYERSLRGEHVPLTLLPNGKELARPIAPQGRK
jgi:hypothetical protein